MLYVDCQYHKKHKTIEVETEIGMMTVYDYDSYKDTPGYCTGQDDVSRTLQIYGHWENDETVLFKDILKKGSKGWVIDIGCHLGWFSKIARNYDYPVLAYDGNKENVDIFGLNVKGAKCVYKFFKDDEKIVEDLPSIEIMKIDIEGAERFAISAFENYLPVTKNILIEITPVFNSFYPELVKKLESFGFVAYFVDGKKFNHNYDFTQTNLLFRK